MGLIFLPAPTSQVAAWTQALGLWCNGVKVYEDRTQRGLAPDSIKVRLTLKAGSNRVTAIVQNGSGGFAFQGRIRSATYSTMALAYLLANDAKREEAAVGLLTLSVGLCHRRPRSEPHRASRRPSARGSPLHRPALVGATCLDSRWHAGSCPSAVTGFRQGHYVFAGGYGDSGQSLAGLGV
jgi:hypothetical protein